MKEKEILRHVDHTLLAQSATWREIRQVCDDAMKYETASVCIPPSYVKQAAEYVGGKTAICTVIGFPNGYETTAVKQFETKDAIGNGADEIDMVINIGWLKDKKYDLVEQEIRSLKKICGNKVLKVIIETCLLTDEEKVKMCEIVTRAGADYIKTSTGFSKAGATFEDIRLFSEHVGERVKMKAAGGIASMDDAERFMELGADRLGTSRIVKIVKESGEAAASNGVQDAGESDDVSENDAQELKAEPDAARQIQNTELSEETIEMLIETAKEQLKFSYSPYSKFKVGAALLTENGKVYTGCNIENAAYSPTNCAERTAFFKAVSEGEREFRAICIVGGTEYTPPCGVCRQVMAEFCDPRQFQVILAAKTGKYKIFRLEELLPLEFSI